MCNILAQLHGIIIISCGAWNYIKYGTSFACIHEGFFHGVDLFFMDVQIAMKSWVLHGEFYGTKCPIMKYIIIMNPWASIDCVVLLLAGDVVTM